MGEQSGDGTTYRRDPLTGEIVLYAPGRRLRPQSPAPDRPAPDRPPPDPAADSATMELVARDLAAGVDAECPFCPGNERLLPPIRLEVPDPAGGPWLARVVPNKYPMVSGPGRHLVVIESPRHSEAPEQAGAVHLETIFRTYRRAFGEVSAQPGVRYTVLFRNHGAAAGASLAHPHAQVVGIDVVPDRVRRREARCHRHHRRTGGCLVCDIVRAEEADGSRLVATHPQFVAFVPWAAEAPFETRIVPRRHQADFRGLRDEDVSGLAAMFHDVSTRVGGVASAYNVTLESCSLRRDGSAQHVVVDDPALHWFLRIRPRMTVAAGFEIATGVSVNPSLPEDDAARLRAPTP